MQDRRRPPAAAVVDVDEERPPRNCAVSLAQMLWRAPPRRRRHGPTRKRPPASPTRPFQVVQGFAVSDILQLRPVSAGRVGSVQDRAARAGLPRVAPRPSVVRRFERVEDDSMIRAPAGPHGHTERDRRVARRRAKRRARAFRHSASTADAGARARCKAPARFRRGRRQLRSSSRAAST